MAVGAEVSKFEVGQQVGIGCMVDSCRKCQHCRAGEEQFCKSGGATFTYDSTYKVSSVGKQLFKGQGLQAVLIIN